MCQEPRAVKMQCVSFASRVQVALQGGTREGEKKGGMIKGKREESKGVGKRERKKEVCRDGK